MCLIVVKPNEMKVSGDGGTLTAVALGSSLSVCLYDEKNRIGGMVHTLLPERPDKGTESGGLKYVESAVDELYQAMLEAGADPDGIWAKLAGGARIFCYLSWNPDLDVGRENVRQAREKLRSLKVPIMAEDTGENFGRTVYFHLSDGSLDIETAGKYRYGI